MSKKKRYTKALYLNRFGEALEFCRGYPIFDLLGASLGITSEMLDGFFETKDYPCLIEDTATDVEEEEVDEDTVTDQ